MDGSAWLQSWLDPQAPGPLRRLDRVRISDASLVLEDKALGKSWGAGGLELDLERTAKGFDTKLSMTVDLAGAKTPLSATASYAIADQNLVTHLELTGFTPASLAGIAPALDSLREIHLSADASLDGVIHKGWEFEVSAFELKTAAGTVSGTVDASEPKIKIAGNVNIRDLRPSILGAQILPLKILSGVRVIVDGHAEFSLDETNHLSISALELGFSDPKPLNSTPAAAPRRASGDDPIADDLGSLAAHDLSFDLHAGEISGQVTAANINPSLLAEHIDLLRPAAGLRLPITAAITATIEHYRPRTVDFSLTAGSGAVDIPAPVGKTQQLAGATIEGRLDGLETLTISRGSLDLGGGAVIDFSTGIELEGRGAQITANADIATLTIERVDELWPGAIAAGVGEWISGHFPTGTVNDIHAEVELGDTGSGFGLRRLTGRFAYTGLRLALFPQAPPIDGITGTAIFDESRFEFSPTGAQIEDLHVTGGTVVISGLEDPPTLLRVDATVEGPVATALALVNGQPLDLVPPSIIAAKDVSGTTATRIQLELPLDGRSSGKVRSFDVGSKLTDFAWSRPPIGPPASKGELSLQVTPSGLTVAGASTFGSAPLTIAFDEYFSGNDLLRRIAAHGDLDREALHSLGLPELKFLDKTIGVDLTYTADRQGGTKIDGSIDLEPTKIDVAEIGWHKPPGAAGRLTATADHQAGGRWTIDPIALSADDLQLLARLVLTDSPLAVESFELGRFHYGRSTLSGSAAAKPAGGFDIRVTGASFDLEPVVSSIAARPPAVKSAADKRTGPPPIDLKIHIDEVHGRDKVGLSDVVADVSFDGTTLQRATVTAEIGADGHLSVVTGISNGRRTATIDVAGLGAVLSLLHIAPYFDGGTLSLNGGAVAVGEPITAHLEMQNLKITKSPLFAQLLRVSSMQGLLATFTGQGLTVNKMQSELSYKDRRLSFDKVTVLADGVGITGAGFIDLAAGTIDCTGYLAPAATIQRIIGKIPLLGQLLTGIHREGLIATQFTIAGPLKKPEVKAKPLSTLTPGLLRDLTRMKPEHKDTE